MYVEQVLIPTRVARAGMTVREFFHECARANTPGLPFCDASGRVTGRVTLKNILKKSCLPDYLVEMAKILGDKPPSVQDIEAIASQLLDSPVDSYVQKTHLSINAGSSALKALAMMEQSDTSYIYVFDKGRYHGVVTIHSLADKLAEYDKSPDNG